MGQPCEKLIFKLLPTIRAELAKKLSKEGVRQQEISRMLDVTPAAVSQYIKGKRGYDLDLDEKSENEIRKLAKRMKEKETEGKEPVKGICRICTKIRENKKETEKERNKHDNLE